MIKQSEPIFLKISPVAIINKDTRGLRVTGNVIFRYQ